MKVALLLVSLSAFVAIASCETTDKETDFKSFLKKYNKEYAGQEYAHRFKIFNDNLELIESLNAKDPKAHYGINKFADLSTEEFRSQYLMKTPPPSIKSNAKTTLELAPSASLPNAFDWRNHSAVTPVKNQWSCGACWAFSVVETIESAWYLAGHNLTELSPQQVVDCSTNGDHGCNGGYPYYAYDYIAEAGLETESAYPYEGWFQPWDCTYNKTDVLATISGYVNVSTATNQNETEMMDVLYQKGPLSVCVDAAQWQFYVWGVISYLCGTEIDHCVQLVGWQNGYVDIEGGSYNVWVVRNSWGEDWGYDGYLYVERGGDFCAIAQMVTLPLIS